MKEPPATLFDFPLLPRQVFYLKAEVMQTNKSRWILRAGADLALVLEERKFDVAVAQIDALGGCPPSELRATESECLYMEIGTGTGTRNSSPAERPPRRGAAATFPGSTRAQ